MGFFSPSLSQFLDKWLDIRVFFIFFSQKTKELSKKITLLSVKNIYSHISKEFYSTFDLTMVKRRKCFHGRLLSEIPVSKILFSF